MKKSNRGKKREHVEGGKHKKTRVNVKRYWILFPNMLYYSFSPSQELDLTLHSLNVLYPCFPINYSYCPFMPLNVF